MKVCPTSDNRIKHSNQISGSCGLICANSFSHFFKIRFDVFLGWFDQKFSVIFTDILTKKIEAVSNVCYLGFLLREFQTAFFEKVLNERFDFNFKQFFRSACYYTIYC